MNALMNDNYKCPRQGCGYTTYVKPGTFFAEPPECPHCKTRLVPKN